MNEQVRDVEYIQGEMLRRINAASDQMRLMEKLRGQASDSLVPLQQKELALALMEANKVSVMLTLDLKTVLDANAALQSRCQAAEARAEALEGNLLARLTDEIAGQLERRTVERDSHPMGSKDWFYLAEQANTLQNVLQDMRYAMENGVTRLEFMRAVALNSFPEAQAQAGAGEAGEGTG